MLRLGTSTLRLLPPPPSIKRPPIPTFSPIMTPRVGLQGAVPDIGADEFSLASQAPESSDQGTE